MVRPWRRFAYVDSWGLFSAFSPVLAIVGALSVSGAFIAIGGISPIAGYQALFEGAFGTANSIGESIVKAIPLIFTGLGVGFAARSGLFNIGAEGQLYIGALFSTVVALQFPQWPPVALVLAALLVGLIGGGLWGALAGFLRANRGLSEVLTTLLLNFVAIYIVSSALHGPIQEKQSYFFHTEILSPSAYLPILVPGTRIHAGLLVVLASAFLYHLLLKRTTLGYQIRAVGFSHEAARTAGINVRRNMVAAMSIGGAFAALAGVTEILGVNYRLADYFSPGYGFDGIAVAFLGRFHAGGIVVAALFFGALRSGAYHMQNQVGASIYLLFVIQALALFFLGAATVIRLWHQKRMRLRS